MFVKACIGINLSIEVLTIYLLNKSWVGFVVYVNSLKSCDKYSRVGLVLHKGMFVEAFIDCDIVFTLLEYFT